MLPSSATSTPVGLIAVTTLRSGGRSTPHQCS